MLRNIERNHKQPNFDSLQYPQYPLHNEFSNIWNLFRSTQHYQSKKLSISLIQQTWPRGKWFQNEENNSYLYSWLAWRTWVRSEENLAQISVINLAMDSVFMNFVWKCSFICSLAHKRVTSWILLLALANESFKIEGSSGVSSDIERCVDKTSNSFESVCEDW